MSVDSRSSTPPPAQSPLTAAMMGFEYGFVFRRARSTIRAVCSGAERSSPISAPAQNARSPAPVIIMQRHSNLLPGCTHGRPSQDWTYRLFDSIVYMAPVHPAADPTIAHESAL